MSTLSAPARSLRILDWDIENRPLTYWVPDMPTAQITAIASMWIGDHDSLRMDYLLTPTSTEEDERGMLGRFIERYNEADMVTGHYIRRHDLPITNAMLYEQGLPLMEAKMSCDTKLDMFKKADLPATQEFLIETLRPVCELGMPLEKFHMSQTSWREANRLTPKGLDLTIRRVMSDVHAHSHLRARMIDLGYLRAPSMWRPGGGSITPEGRHR